MADRTTTLHAPPLVRINLAQAASNIEDLHKHLIEIAAELLCAIAESPRARRAAETFAASLLLACSAAQVAQSGAVVPIGRTGGE